MGEPSIAARRLPEYACGLPRERARPTYGRRAPGLKGRRHSAPTDHSSGAWAGFSKLALLPVCANRRGMSIHATRLHLATGLAQRSAADAHAPIYGCVTEGFAAFDWPERSRLLQSKLKPTWPRTSLPLIRSVRLDQVMPTGMRKPLFKPKVAMACATTMLPLGASGVAAEPGNTILVFGAKLILILIVCRRRN